MKKMFKSAVAIMLAAVMVFGGAPTGALAGLTEWLGGLSLAASATSYAVGDIVEFGRYPQPPESDSSSTGAKIDKTKSPVFKNVP